MERNNCTCDQCRKIIENASLAWFSDAEKDLDFCSENCYSKYNNKEWKEIHPEFTEELVTEWKKKGFDYDKVEKLIKKGLNPSEARLVSYGRYKGLIWGEPKNFNLNQLRTEYQNNPTWLDWTDIYQGGIHRGFGDKPYYPSNETYQQKWEQANIAYEEVKEWIVVSFKPNDYSEVKQWKNLNFSPTETKTWLEVGLDKYEREFASWLRTNNHIPELVKNNLERLRNDYENLKVNNSRAWLEQVYPYNIKELDIGKLYAYKDKLTGELNLSQYQQLEKLSCSGNKLTKITLPVNPTSLKKLDLRNNNFPEQDLSFLIPYTNLEELDLGGNKFTGSLEPLEGLIKLTNLDIYNTLITGSLDYLNGMKQLKILSIHNTDINEVNIDKLPKSLKEINYSTEYRPDCKLASIVPLLEPVKWGWCDKCKEPNTSENWCQPCADQKWKQLTGQELIEKFIEQQRNELEWIPYEEFTDIKYLAEGGFSKVYKAQRGKYVVLKSLNDSNFFSEEKESQNIIEFLTEVVNTKLVEGYGSNIVSCYGISQDPTTKNYFMVMKYMEKGNLRQYLQNKDNELPSNPQLSLEHKLRKLKNIAQGLYYIHRQNLVHQDFHSGNILNSRKEKSRIADLGLSRPINQPKQEGQIFGVLPYVAPEVLLGKPYTQKADIYSWGIIAYEFLTNSYPYYECANDDLLAIKICQGLRPNLESPRLSLPQKVKDLIKSCWDSNPNQRPQAEELWKIIKNWKKEIMDKENTPFYQQYLEIEQEYNTFSQNTPYQIHDNAILHSKAINTKEITKLLETYSQDLVVDFTNLKLEGNQEEQEQNAQIQISPK